MTSTSYTASRQDLYQHVTRRILIDLERGVRPWMKPWSTGNTAGLPLRYNGVAYQGINVLLLWSEGVERGFSSPTWMTFRQAQVLGGQVRRGEHGTLIVYADRFIMSEDGQDGQSIERSIPFLKGYTVFNAEQIEGLPEKYRVQVPASDVGLRHSTAEAFIEASGATLRYGGDRAFYVPALDLIQLPPVAAFRDRESLYATTLHELAHWTGAPARCARDLTGRFGSDAYAFEELIAEMGSAFLCAELGVTPEVREDHAAYLASWLEVLKRDKRALFSAASLAQRAADYLRGLSGAAGEQPC